MKIFSLYLLLMFYIQVATVLFWRPIPYTLTLRFPIGIFLFHYDVAIITYHFELLPPYAESVNRTWDAARPPVCQASVLSMTTLPLAGDS